MEKEHSCTECDKTFSFFHELKAHLARHARNLVHPCTVCGEEFTKHSDMRKHRTQAHSRKRSYAESDNDDAESRHSESGTESLPYHECEICDYRSLSK